MPTVAIINDVWMLFYYIDHAPQHFHVEFARHSAQIRLDDGTDSLRMEAEGLWDPIKREWTI
ncbi:MAG: hypothetical protein AAFQ11_00830 [Pseudomonadota bacterium]